MIEDKKMGLKIAESKEEAIWNKVKEAREKSIESLKESLLIEKAVLKLAETKLQEFNKNDRKSVRKTG